MYSVLIDVLKEKMDDKLGVIRAITRIFVTPIGNWSFYQKEKYDIIGYENNIIVVIICQKYNPIKIKVYVKPYPYNKQFY